MTCGMSASLASLQEDPKFDGFDGAHVVALTDVDTQSQHKHVNYILIVLFFRRGRLNAQYCAP